MNVDFDDDNVTTLKIFRGEELQSRAVVGSSSVEDVGEGEYLDLQLA